MSSEDVRDTVEGDEQENQQQQQQQHLLDSSPAIAQQIDVTSSTHTGENQENSAAQSSPEKPAVDSTVSTSTAAKPTSCANGASIDDTTTSSSQIAVKPLSNSAAGDGLATAAAKESELDETAPTVEPSDTPATAVPLKASIPIKVTYKRNVLELSVSPDDTVEVIKKSLESLTDVPVKMQKLMYKGIASNEKTIRQLGVPPNSKFLLIGSTQSDVQSVSRKPSSKELREPQVVEKKAQPLSERRPHSKILGYGVPADAYPGILHVQEPLPRAVHGMLNKANEKVRLTFKLESDEIWLSSNSRTDKIPIGSLTRIVTERIAEHQQYHIIGLQRGKTEDSIYWIYWFPSQYINALKDLSM